MQDVRTPPKYNKYLGDIVDFIIQIQDSMACVARFFPLFTFLLQQIKPTDINFLYSHCIQNYYEGTYRHFHFYILYYPYQQVQIEISQGDAYVYNCVKLFILFI